MTRKILSLATVAGIAYVYFQSLFRYDDALFLLISNNLLIDAFFLCLAVGGAWLSFQKKFESWQLYVGCASLAILLGGFGLLGIVFSSFDNTLYNLFMPLDYLVMMELGIIYGVCALSYKHQPIPKNVTKYMSIAGAFQFSRQIGAVAMQRLNGVKPSRPARRRQVSTSSPRTVSA